MTTPIPKIVLRAQLNIAPGVWRGVNDARWRVCRRVCGNELAPLEQLLYRSVFRPLHDVLWEEIRGAV